MENILLIGILAATFVFGYFVVRQVDRALDTGWRTPEEPVRIGFAEPCAADSLSGTWEGIPVRLFSGSAEELLAALGAEELDLIFCRNPLTFPAICAIMSESCGFLHFLSVRPGQVRRSFP